MGFEFLINNLSRSSRKNNGRRTYRREGTVSPRFGGKEFYLTPLFLIMDHGILSKLNSLVSISFQTSKVTRRRIPQIHSIYSRMLHLGEQVLSIVLLTSTMDTQHVSQVITRKMHYFISSIYTYFNVIILVLRWYSVFILSICQVEAFMR